MESEEEVPCKILPEERGAMMLASIDTNDEGNDCQENNLAMLPIEAVPNKKESLVSASTDTESETDNCSQNISEKMSHGDASLKEMEPVKSECAGIQSETHDIGRENNQVVSPNFAVREPEKVHVHVPESTDAQIETNDSGQEESVTVDRSTRLEHNPSWSSSSHDLEPAQNQLPREVIGLHFPTETHTFRQNQSNMSLQQDQIYSMQVSKTTVVKESVVGEGLVRVTKDSEMITTVNKGSEDISHTGNSAEEIFDDIRDKNLDKTRPSTSVSRVKQKAPDIYVRKSFTCDNSMVDEDDEELREHWTRTLQTSTSTGEIVEEIVRVLKHQKTHDLLCPVCGSCITKRVILRKRKRSNLISVEKLYQDHAEEIQVQDSSTNIMDSAIEQESSLPAASDEQTLDPMAYGCLACFSLFFQKGHHLWSQIEGAAEQDAISCLPFFFPPYPWGMSQRRKRRPEMVHPSPGLVEQIVTTAETIPQDSVQKEDDRIKPQIVISKGETQPWIDKCDAICGLAPALLPDFHWGSKVQKEDIVMENEVEGDYVEQGGGGTCDLNSVVLPTYKWGHATKTEGDWKANGVTTEDEKLSQQEVHLKAHFKAKTGVIMAASKWNRPFKAVGSNAPPQPSALNEVEKPPTNLLSSVASTGYALLEGLPEKSALTTRPSTGFSLLQDPGLLPQFEKPETPKDSAPVQEMMQEIDLSFTATQNSKSKIGWMFPKFLWSVGKVTSDDLTKPLLKKGKATISGPKEMQNENLVSVLKIEGPSGDESYLAPLSPAMPELEEGILQIGPSVLKKPLEDEVQLVIDVQPSEEEGRPTTGVGIADTIADAVAPVQPTEQWDILRSIVYGGLDISVASLGVTSSAAGGAAITRTVVYMGLATLFSGIIGFYHNVLNLYYHYQEYYKSTIGKTLMLNGTVAVISYVLFGMLSAVTYGLSFRDSNNRDKKFALCCGVAFVSILILSLGKAHVTNKRFLRTVSSYIFGGFLAAIIGYLTGEHISKLLESWGI